MPNSVEIIWNFLVPAKNNDKYIPVLYLLDDFVDQVLPGSSFLPFLCQF